MKEVLAIYREKLSKIVAPMRDSDGGTRMQHLLWMCNTVDHFIDSSIGIPNVPGNDWEKMNRWFGFIQGVLWCEGFFTIDEMREHSRPVGERFTIVRCDPTISV
jgi:hypothetical protein